jgi:transcriptional regulator with XRE-family HTH domain
MSAEFSKKVPSETLVAAGRAVRVLRGCNRWTQEELEVQTQGRITQGSISKIEKGKVALTNDTLEQLLLAFNVPFSQFWKLVEELNANSKNGEESTEQYLDCLVHTGVEKEEIASLYAEVDLQTITRCDHLANKIASNIFDQPELEELANLIMKMEESPPIVLRRMMIDIVMKLGKLAVETRRRVATTS